MSNGKKKLAHGQKRPCVGQLSTEQNRTFSSVKFFAELKYVNIIVKLL
jgi:hypothetical protein